MSSLTAAESGKSPSRFCAPDLIRVPAAQGSDFVYSLAAQKGLRLPKPAAELLERCRTFAEPEELARQAVPPGRASGALIQLAAAMLLPIREAGLLTSESEVLRAVLRDRVECPERFQITDVCVMAHGQDEGMDRCLQSHIMNALHYDRRPNFSVLHACRDSNLAEQRRGALARLARTYGVSIRYAGPLERAEFAKQIALASGVTPRIIEFAIGDWEARSGGTGATHNAAVLQSVGRLALTVDAHSECRVVKTGHGGSLMLTSSGDARTLRFFVDPAILDRGVSFSTDSALLVHECLLGRSLPDCIADFPAGAIELRTMTAPLFRMIATGRGRVRVSLNGMVGDCGKQSSSGYLWLEGEARSELMLSADVYGSIWRSRQVTRTVDQYCITEVPCRSSALAAIDNRGLLPPVIPLGRDAHDMFGMLLRHCAPESCFAYVPQALVHTLTSPPSFATNELWEDVGFTLRELMELLVDAVAPQHISGTAEQRMDQIGERLAELGRADSIEFLDFLRRTALTYVHAKMHFIEDILERYGNTPDYWAGDVKRHRRAWRELLCRQDWFVPSELTEAFGAAEEPAALQTIVGLFGELLRSWPAMRDAAAELRRRGIELAKEI
jgi:hypothetical protein